MFGELGPLVDMVGVVGPLVVVVGVLGETEVMVAVLVLPVVWFGALVKLGAVVELLGRVVGSATFEGDSEWGELEKFFPCL